MRRTVRATISIPSDLKERMEMLNAVGPVNWSEIACAAFEEFLTRAEAGMIFDPPSLIGMVRRLERLEAEVFGVAQDGEARP